MLHKSFISWCLGIHTICQRDAFYYNIYLFKSLLRKGCDKTILILIYLLIFKKALNAYLSHIYFAFILNPVSTFRITKVYLGFMLKDLLHSVTPIPLFLSGYHCISLSQKVSYTRQQLYKYRNLKKDMSTCSKRTYIILTTLFTMKIVKVQLHGNSYQKFCSVCK